MGYIPEDPSLEGLPRALLSWTTDKTKKNNGVTYVMKVPPNSIKPGDSLCLNPTLTTPVCV